MDLENLVEKITREVMEKMDKSPPMGSKFAASTSGNAQTGTPKTSASTAVLLAGSSGIDPGSLREAVTFLRSRNVKVTLAVAPGCPTNSVEGVRTIQCQNFRDCQAALRNSQLIVVLLSDIATISKIANLVADRFDVEAVIKAVESGKEVWALKTLPDFPPAFKNKVNSFLDQIKGYGIKITSIPAASGSSTSFEPVRASTVSPSPAATTCSVTLGEECAGCGLCANLNPQQVKNIVDKGADRITATPGISVVSSDLAGMIDHTLLKPDVTREDVLKLCREAKEYGFASCCVNPTWVSTVAECLKGSPVKTCVVVGFPLGANSSVIKAMETRDAVAAGADEVDMVINVGALKAGDYDLVRKDIESVVEAAQGRIVKVILETSLLTDEEKVKGCQLAKQAGADFVKTSTGFGPGGATVKDVALMRQTVGKYMGVKASGGIRDFKKAQEMIRAGATRIGASAGVAIVKGSRAKEGSGY